MTTTFEFEGKNVEKALEKASEKFDIPKDQLQYDIISHGSSGIFGLAGTKKARIQVKLAEASTPFGGLSERALNEFSGVA